MSDAVVSPTLPVLTLPFPRVLVRAQNVALTLYVVSLATSMGGMEIFSSALALLAALFFFWGREQNPTRLKWGLPPYFWPMTAFVLIALLGIALGSGASVRDKLYDMGRMRFFILYAVLFYTLRDFGLRYRWVKILAGATFIVGLYGFVQHFMAIDLFRPEGKKVLLYAIQDQKIGPLVVGTFNHHLTFSSIYLIYACLFTALGISREPTILGVRRWLFLGLGAFLYVLCFWTQSRAAWFAIPCTLIVLMAGKGMKSIAVTLALVGALMVGFYATDMGFRERFNRTFLQQDDLYNLGPRSRLWAAQIEIFKEHPLIGIGYNNNERHAKEYVDRLYPDRKDNFYGHAHCTPLQILATMGILGLAAYLWMWFEIFQTMFRTLRASATPRLEKQIALGLLAGFVGFHLQGLTQWNFGDAEVIHNYIFFWAVVACLPFVDKMAAPAREITT